MSKTTIDDVARLAKVSIKTVSRVVNKEKNVRPQTRERVERAIAALNYRPNPSARGLAGNRSFVIALLYDNPSASYITSIQEGALAACQAANYELLIHPSDYENPNLANEIQQLREHSRIDGFLITPPLTDVAGFTASLERNHTPYVHICPGDRAALDKAVFTNDREICAEMIRYLVSLGHERIGFIVGHPDHKAVGARFQGYKDGLKQSGLTIDRSLIKQGYNSFESGIVCGKKLLGGARPPTAIFAANDDMAAGVIRVAHESRLRIPDDLSVVGFDDVPLAEHIFPTLTTIRQPMQAMGTRAGELLLAQLGGEAPNRELIEIPSTIKLRESTGAPDTGHGEQKLAG